MIVDKTPVVDHNLLTVTVVEDIDPGAEVWILINGVIGFTNDDFEISGNVIDISLTGIDPDDEISVMYNKLVPTITW